MKITPKLPAAIRDWVLLKIDTDGGITGLGEWSTNASDAQLNSVKKQLIGADPMNINALHHPY